MYAQKSREQMGGVYYAYHVPVDEQDIPVPHGAVPFYISHYGRHGSRWVTSDARYQWIISQFADKDNLTPLGKKMRKRLEKVWKNAEGNGGKLSPLGVVQHRGIADRMLKRFPQVFQRGLKVEAYSSTVDRCVKSMNAFCVELSHSQGFKGFVSQSSDAENMKWIIYSSPAVKQLANRVHPRRYLGNERFIAALFKNPLKVKDPEKLMSEIYAVYSDIQDVNVKVDLSEFFTDDECRDLYEQNNTRMWICNGQAPENYGVPQLSAVSLWENIKTKAEYAMAHGDVAADLRFGHDTALYHLLSLFGFMCLSDERVDEMDQVIPMAANLQIVFYCKPELVGKPLSGKQVFVKFLVNEKAERIFKLRSLDVAADGRTGYYYRWDFLVKYIEKRIQSAIDHQHLYEVNTMVGTDNSSNPVFGHYSEGTEKHGQTLPAVLEPNGMNFWTPQTRYSEEKCVAPYYYSDDKFRGFRNSHWLVGGCAQDYGSFTLMPMMDNLRLKVEDRYSKFNHYDEISHPDYYSVLLPDDHLKAEMTGISHSAIFRFTYQKEGKAYFVISPNSDRNEGFVSVDKEKNCIYGYNPVHRIYQGWGEKAGFNGWFAVEFEDPIVEYGVDGAVAWVAFDVNKGDEINVKAASSFVDMKGVYNNIAQEIPHWEFNDTRCRNIDKWKSRFKEVMVESADSALVEKFYGALYRASFLPRAISDKDGRYPSFNGGKKIKQNYWGKIGNSPIYGKSFSDFPAWDTYRALMPFNVLVSNGMGTQYNSFLSMYEDGGWLPIFPCWNSYTSAMIGDHVSAALAEAIVKGVSNINMKVAYEAMRKNAFETPSSFEDYRNGMGRRALKSYLKYGYIPLEDSVKEAFHTQEQVSRTLEYAYDDFALAQVAKKMGMMKDYQLLMKRSQNWRNVINPQTGWADGRYKNGRWLGNKDIKARKSFITEGAVSHYTWYVPHDVYGLMKIMGGKRKYIEKLDRMFSDSLYWHGNEPCHQIAYMYAYAGEPWKTQQYVREIMNREYRDVPGGLSGNEDAGQMSAWYLFSSLGFYPVCPVSPYYVIGSPSLDRVQIGEFVIVTENASAENVYIQSATYNGQPYTKNYVTLEMLRGDGLLKFVMGPKPNKNWGCHTEDCPPDLSLN